MRPTRATEMTNDHKCIASGQSQAKLPTAHDSMIATIHYEKQKKLSLSMERRTKMHTTNIDDASLLVCCPDAVL